MNDSQSFAELSLVRSIKEIRDGETVVPAGATGTIVYVDAGRFEYLVEFTHPHVVVGALHSELVTDAR